MNRTLFIPTGASFSSPFISCSLPYGTGRRWHWPVMSPKILSTSHEVFVRSVLCFFLPFFFCARVFCLLLLLFFAATLLPLSVCLSACLPACLSVCLSVCLPVSLSVSLSLRACVCSSRSQSCFLCPCCWFRSFCWALSVVWRVVIPSTKFLAVLFWPFSVRTVSGDSANFQSYFTLKINQF